MDEPITAALLLAAGLGLLGAGTAAVQVRELRRLAARTHVPSDERAFFRGRYRRRLLIAVVLLVAGAMIGGAYLSGMEERAAAIGDGRRRAAAAAEPDAPRPPVPDEDRRFVRLWGLYWIGVVGLVAVLVALAMADGWAARRFWYAQYRRLREEHQTKLRRDLAVYQTQKRDRRGRLGGRLGGADEA